MKSLIPNIKPALCLFHVFKILGPAVLPFCHPNLQNHGDCPRRRHAARLGGNNHIPQSSHKADFLTSQHSFSQRMEIIVGKQVHGKYHPTYRSPRKISRMSGKQMYFTCGSSQLIITGNLIFIFLLRRFQRYVHIIFVVSQIVPGFPSAPGCRFWLLLVRSYDMGLHCCT